jgi:hypothetical protein
MLHIQGTGLTTSSSCSWVKINHLHGEADSGIRFVWPALTKRWPLGGYKREWWIGRSTSRNVAYHRIVAFLEGVGRT